MKRFFKNPMALLFIPGILFLATDPILWLVDTWFDPTWDSPGLWIALAVVALIFVSVASGPARVSRNERRLALGLLLVTAVLRLCGRLLAIRGIGALALVADVAAIALLLGVRRRPWALSPWAAAGLFAFSLPVEMWLQRILGYPLRLLSAELAHGLLHPFFPALQLQGTLLVGEGGGLAVDLPCSGAQGLIMLSGLCLGLLCRRKPTRLKFLLLPGLLALAAILSNSLRIVLLYIGQDLGLDIFAEPTHSTLGLVALGAGSLLLLFPLAQSPARQALPPPLPAPTAASPRASAGRRPSLRRAAAALGFTTVAALVASAPAHPLDVSGQVNAPQLPQRLAGWRGQDLPLSPIEARYFGHYGGQALKRHYRDPLSGGGLTLILVRTTSPLRHLHGPERCLAGAGHRVQRLGVVPGKPPAVRWRSTDPQGRVWEVRGSFLGPDGRGAASLAELVWRWMSGERGDWTLAERISPEAFCKARPARCRAFDAALFAALDAADLENTP